MAGEKEIQSEELETTEMEPLEEVGIIDKNISGLDDKDPIEPLQGLNDSDTSEAENNVNGPDEPEDPVEEAFDESELSSALGQSEIDKAIAAMQKGAEEAEENNPMDEPVSTDTESIADPAAEKGEAESADEEETEKDDLVIGEEETVADNKDEPESQKTEDNDDPEDEAGPTETESASEETEAEHEIEEETDISASAGDDESAEFEQEEADADTAGWEEAEKDDAVTEEKTAVSDVKEVSDTKIAEDKDDNEFVGLDDEDEVVALKGAETETDHEAGVKPATSDSSDKDEVVEDKASTEKSEAEKPEKPVKNKVKKKDKEKPAKIKTPATKKKPAVSKNKNGAKSIQKSAGSHRILKIAAIIVGLAAVALYANPAILKLGKETKTPVVKQIEAPVEESKVQQHERKPTKPIDNHRTRLAEAKSLRQELLVKKEEIYELNEHYQSGVANLEYDILEEMRRNDITSFSQALKNKRIELSLRTIQRRQAYTQLLKKPVEWIDSGSEKLLYLTRKAIFDLQISPVASGVDMDRHMRHLNAVIQKYRLSADKLTIDVRNADFQAIEDIWARINNQKEQVYAAREHAHNQNIWEEICAGNLSRIGEMTNLSAEAAACLSEIKGADLFLNGIADLSVNAVENLVNWRGNWICLNGFKTLPPAIATHLFQWEGNWLSLNGLSEFSPELAALLANWKGQQLELMGLNYREEKTDRIGLKYLAQWEKAGGKLYVPERIRKEIEKMM